MATTSRNVVRRILNTRDDHISDLTAPFYELEPFDSVVHALQWKQLKRRLPVCLKKTLRNRFMLPNLMYLGYAIGLLIIDFDENLNPPPNSTVCETSMNQRNSSKTLVSILDQPIQNDPLVNQLYIGSGSSILCRSIKLPTTVIVFAGLAVVGLVAGFLYCWAWHGRSLFDIIMIPEYLNITQAVLYLWTALWYSKQDTLSGYYTMAIHKIELVASILGVVAAIGWVLSWFMTYTRVLGRGYTLDDPDMIACIAIVVNAIIYIIYNIQLNLAPQDYETNMLYRYGDIVGFIEACFCVFACLRDDNWFYFLPLAGQYGIALGRVQVETKTLPQFGKAPILLNGRCRRNDRTKFHQQPSDMKIRQDIITVPIFTSPTQQSLVLDT